MDKISSVVIKDRDNTNRHISRLINAMENVAAAKTEQPDIISHHVVISIGNAITIDNRYLDVEFTVPFDSDGTPDEAEFIIYNLSKATQDNIKTGNLITVRAGYKNDIGIIFTGYISKVELDRADLDKKLVINAIDNMSFTDRDVIEKSYQANTKASQILKDLLLTTKIPIAVFQCKADYVFQNSVKVDGKLIENVTKYAEICEVDVYINKQKIYCHNIREASKDINFLISTDTGMIEAPEKFTNEKDITLEKSSSSSTDSSDNYISTSNSTIDKALAWAKKIADDNSHGYSQASRWGPDYDCSSFVISAYVNAGVDVKSAGANATASMYSPFLKCGFKDVSSSVNFSTGSGMQPGDVVLQPGSHTEMIYSVSGGSVMTAGAHTDYDGKTGDSSGREINISRYSNHPYRYCLRLSTQQSANTTNNTSEVAAIDTDSTTTQTTTTSTDTAKQAKKIIELPSGKGRVFTYMGWQLITSKTSNQYKLREKVGQKFDSEGFGVIGGRYAVAMTTTYGNVGDMVDVYQSDGNVFHCVIADIKNQADSGCNKWGHLSGQCVLEFVVDKYSWYDKKNNPGTSSNHPEWGGKYITKVINYGSYLNNGDTDSNTSAENTVSIDASKKVTETGYTVKMLMQYRIQPGVKVKIKSINVNGTFSVQKGEHSYNGTDMITELTVLDETVKSETTVR